MAGPQTQPDPDSGKVTDNTFASTFFKFHYSFPQGWSAVNDDTRIAENRSSHEKQVREMREKAPPDTANRKTTTGVFQLYDLLIATPKPLATSEKPTLPHISVWAQERFSMLNEPGDYGKLLVKFPGAMILRKPEEVIISGRKFVRADFVHNGKSFEALFVTSAGKYLVGFEIRGSNEKEINDLAQTMQTLHFD
jgi:hypothetical protein